MREIVRAVLFVSALMLGATNANAQGTMPDHVFEAWPPVPPLNEQSVAHYCIHRNLLYSTGAVLCEGGQGLVCAPGATGEQAYWSSVPVNRGGVDWTPPAHCGK
jgi:hypothetical protein